MRGHAFTAAGAAVHSRWFHYGLTSNDVVDTAQALQCAQASAVVKAGIARLGAALKAQAHKYKDTVQMGRTHGIHAEPVTF